MSSKCYFCGNEDSALLWAEHKELGGMWICSDCWKKIYDKNLFVAGSGSSSSSSNSSCACS